MQFRLQFRLRLRGRLSVRAGCRIELRIPFSSPPLPWKQHGKPLGFSLNHSVLGLGPDSVLCNDLVRETPGDKNHGWHRIKPWEETASE